MTHTWSTLTVRRSAALAAGGTLALTMLTGCGGNGLRASTPADPSITTPSTSPSTSPSASTTTASASASPSATRTVTTSPTAASPSASPSTSRVPAQGPPVCALSALHVSVRPEAGGGTAGSTYVLLDFANTSSSTCTLDGHPGVSFVGGQDGTQIGAPAERTTSTRMVTLTPGRSTTALLRIAEAGNYDAEKCAPTTADGLRVYPPDSRASAFVPLRVQACQRALGDQHQLSVSAVGRAS